MSCEGERAIAQAIVANEDTALRVLVGFELIEYRDVLGMSDANRYYDNEYVLRSYIEQQQGSSLREAEPDDIIHRTRVWVHVV
jgi:hypothetical protein